MKTRAMVTLATKNLFRHGKRTLITAAAIAVGLTVFVFMDSLLQGISEDTERNLVLYETGTAQVVADGYVDERAIRPLTYPIERVDEVRQRLDAAGIESAARTVFSGELIVFRDPFPEDGSVQIVGYGIDPDEDGEVFRLRDTVSAGRYLEPGEEGVLLGGWLAEDIDADVGYPVTIVTRTRDGFYQTMDLEVVGIVTTPNPVVNRNAIFVPLDTVDRYLQMDGAVTEIAVLGALTGRDRNLQERMERELAGLPGLNVVGWEKLATDYVALAQAKQSGSGVILFLVFVIAAVGVSNTVLMSVLERTREIGMMRAMGMYDGEITRTLLLEAIGIGVIGSVAGVILGAAVNMWLVTGGIDYGFALRDMDMGYRVASVVRGTWNISTFVNAFTAGVVITVMTAVVPVRRALKRTVVDALRVG